MVNRRARSIAKKTLRKTLSSILAASSHNLPWSGVSSSSVFCSSSLDLLIRLAAHPLAGLLGSWNSTSYTVVPLPLSSTASYIWADIWGREQRGIIGEPEFKPRLLISGGTFLGTFPPSTHRASLRSPTNGARILKMRNFPQPDIDVVAEWWWRFSTTTVKMSDKAVTHIMHIR